MIRAFRHLFESTVTAAARGAEVEEREHGYHVATAALLVEVMRADHEVQPEERDAVLRALRAAFADLSADETRDLLARAEQHADQDLADDRRLPEVAQQFAGATRQYQQHQHLHQEYQQVVLGHRCSPVSIRADDAPGTRRMLFNRLRPSFDHGVHGASCRSVFDHSRIHESAPPLFG